MAHEWLGIAIFALFILHHILNIKWSKSIFKGKYTPYRVFQTAMAVLALISMLGSMASGVVLSRYALSFLKISGGQSWARNIHMLSAYWGLCIISLHLGIHWSAMTAMVKRLFKKPFAVGSRIARAVGALVAGYGAYAFIKRDIGNYMLLKYHFVFFDFDEPPIFFLLDYNAVMLAYGGGSIKKNGIYDEIIGILNSAGKSIVEFSGIMPNPTCAKVREGAKLA